MPRVRPVARRARRRYVRCMDPIVGGFRVGAVALPLSMRRAHRGDRLAGLAIAGVVAICTSTTALTSIALDPALPWPVHAAGAVAGMGYLSVIAVVLWLRFSYLFE